MADTLESLDNSTIREKCIQYGLPNIPVTDSTRKVMIKKLRVSMGGNGPSTPNEVKKRRETIHNTKKPSPAEEVVEKKAAAATKPAQNRARTRYTIADTSTMDVADPPRTIAPEPTYFEKAVEEPNFKKPEQQTRSVKPVAVEVVNPRERYVKPTVEVNAREQIRSYQQPTVELNSREHYRSTQPSVDLNSREQYRSTQPTVDLTSRDQYRSFQDVGSRPQLSKTGVVTTSYSLETSPTTEKKRLYPDLDEGMNFAGRTSSTYGTSRYTEPDRFNMKGSSNLSFGRTNRDHFDVDDEEEDGELEEEYDEQEEEEEDAIQTPYLSNFARNLERLKDDPIAKLPSPLPTRLSPDVRSSAHYASPQVRKQIRTETDDVSANFQQFMIALENKYNLRRNFSIILAVILAVFIYVFFIM